jgi:Flp pilus assembly protein TadD
MSEARIGRILVASLHQAIADVLPDRLEFYENWLNARGLRGGTIGLAAVSAVLSFLRGEDDGAYEKVVRLAGQHAADWTLLGTGRVRRALALSLPRRIRARRALALARRVIRGTYVDSRAIVKVRRGVAHVDLRGSLFCEVREAGDRGLCGFYLALIERLLERYNVPSHGAIDSCRGIGSRGCGLLIPLGGRSQAAAAAMVAGALLGLPGTSAAGQPVSPLPERLLVVPFENLERDPALYWLSEGSAILLTDALNELGAAALRRADRVRAFEQLQLPAASVLSRATVIKVGQLVGATRVVGGTLERITIEDADALLVRVRSVRLDTGRLEPEIVERAPVDELFDLFHRVGGRLLGRTPTAAGERPPPVAFEQFVKGLLAETPQAQARFLEDALRTHPAFHRARLALWEARTQLGEHTRALAAVSPVPAASPWSRRARFAAAQSLVDLRRLDEAFTAFAALQEEQPSAAVLNNLGAVQVRRGRTAGSGPPATYFDRARAADPDDPDVYFNLGYASALDLDPQAALHWLREAVRRNPADADAHLVLAAVLHATGNTVEARREQELAGQLSADYEALASSGATERWAVPNGLERLKHELDSFRATLDATIATPAQRGPAGPGRLPPGARPAICRAGA